MEEKDVEIDQLSEQLRREIRERMDIFLNDANDLAKKYCGAEAVRNDPTLAFPIASALSQHFASHIVANAMREFTAATKDSAATIRMLAAWQQDMKKGR
jgi:hypothetical protein